MTLTMIICMKLVRNKLDDTLEDVENTFYYTKTENDGYYRVEDQNGHFIYPVLLQRVLYPVLKINEPDER